MIKNAPTLAATAAIALFALLSFGTMLYLWLAFGGPAPLQAKGYRLEIGFPEATSLTAQADVRIAGVNVGKVVAVSPGAGDRAVATLELQARYAPIPRGTRATLRLKSLLGETYVELAYGRRGRGHVQEGARLPDAAVSSTVQLDEILSTFDPETRAGFQTWMQSQAAGLKGRALDINTTFGSLPEFVDSGQRLLTTLDSQSAAVRRLVSSTGSVFGAISERQGELSGLIRSSNNLFSTIAQRNEDFAGVFEALPRFESESRRALPALTRFAKRADPVVRRLVPVAEQLTPTFAQAGRLAPEFRALFERLGPAVTASRRGLPAFERILTRIPPLLDTFQPFLRNANPMVEYIGRYKREITAFFANVTAASLASDNSLPRTRNLVHYLRTSQTLSPEALAFLPRALGSTRNNAYRAPGAFGQLPQGLSALQSGTCANGNPAPPSDAIPTTLAPLVQQFAFRTPGRDVGRPACKAQGPMPGFATAFPQLKAEP